MRDFEDSNLTKHISEQVVIIKFMMTVVVILCMILSRIKENPQMFMNHAINKNIVLISHSLLTITIVVMAILKHIKIRQLTIKQLLRFSQYQLNPLGINYGFVGEVMFLMVHPNLLIDGKCIQITQPVHGLYTKIEVNNILQMIMLCRIYILYNAIISSTVYLSTRGNRICRIYSTNCNLYFGLKCMFSERPLFLLTVIFVSTLLTFGEMMRLSQDNFVNSALENYENCLWCVVIAMGTVGYGDVVPKSYLGRMILFMASITGIIISTLLILTLSTYLSMQFSQSKAHVTLQRLVLRDNLESLAKGVIHQVALISKLERVQGQKQLKGLKKRTDDVRYTLRKIRNIIDTSNVNEDMDRLFQRLQDNLKQTYLNQVQFVNAVEKIYVFEKEKIKDMGFSFSQEIENIIRDR